MEDKPAILLSSAVVVVTPSRIFNSPAVDVTAVLAICKDPAGMFTAPVNVAPDFDALAFNWVWMFEVTPSV